MLHIKIRSSNRLQCEVTGNAYAVPFRFKTSLRAFRATWGSFIMSPEQPPNVKTSARRKGHQRRSSESKGFPVMHDTRSSAKRSTWAATYSTILSGSWRSPRDAARSVAASPRIVADIEDAVLLGFCHGCPFRKRCVIHIPPFGPAATSLYLAGIRHAPPYGHGFAAGWHLRYAASKGPMDPHKPPLPLRLVEVVMDLP